MVRFLEFSKALSILAEKEAEKRDTPSTDTDDAPSTTSSRGSNPVLRLFSSPMREEEVFKTMTPGCAIRDPHVEESATSNNSMRRRIRSLEEENSDLIAIISELQNRVSDLIDTHDADCSKSDALVKSLERQLTQCKDKLNTAIDELQNERADREICFKAIEAKHRAALTAIHKAHVLEIDEMRADINAHSQGVGKLHTTYLEEMVVYDHTSQQHRTPVKSIHATKSGQPTPDCLMQKVSGTPNRPSKTVKALFSSVDVFELVLSDAVMLWTYGGMMPFHATWVKSRIGSFSFDC